MSKQEFHETINLYRPNAMLDKHQWTQLKRHAGKKFVCKPSKKQPDAPNRCPKKHIASKSAPVMLCKMYDDETPNFCKSGTRENLHSVRFIISSSSPSVVCRFVAREVELRSVKKKSEEE
jgi:hypothetical protein